MFVSVGIYEWSTQSVDEWGAECECKSACDRLRGGGE